MNKRTQRCEIPPILLAFLLLFSCQTALASASWQATEGRFQSLIIIDPSVAESADLVSAANGGAAIELLLPDTDGVSQISSIMAKYSGISELHIVSHGDAGRLLLGSTALDSSELEKRSSEVALWHNSLLDGADVLLYGCNVAEKSGSHFVRTLSDLLGADVAASTDVTANEAHGGDWQLEFTTGPIESGSAFSSDFMQSTAMVLSLPTDFADQLVLDSLTQPVDLTVLPSGKLMILEKQGRIVLTDPAASTSAASTYVTIPNVDSQSEKGLLGIALDPNFQSNHYFYVYYHNSVVDRARISRYFDYGTHALPQDEFVIWEDNLATATQIISDHWGGGLSFGPDGYLYLTIGDKKDYPNDAQDLLKTAGKILRFDTSGAYAGGPWVQGSDNPHLVPDSNPFIDGPGGKPDEIWAFGLRNPFRAKWDLPSGRLFIGEVGGNVQSGVDASYEDVHQATTSSAGVNFGWPMCEGPACTGPAPANYSPAIFSIRHPVARAIVMGPVYRGNLFPSEYSNALFFADYVNGWLRYLTFDASGAISAGMPTTGRILATSNSMTGVVSIATGVDGALYYLKIGTSFVKGQLRRITYNNGNRPPVITAATATPTSGSAPPLQVNFTGSATDPDGNTLTYQWNFGDGASASGANTAHTYTAKGKYEAVLSVADGVNTTMALPVTISLGSPPVATIATPAANAGFTAGNVIQIRGRGTDPDGTLTNDSMRWSLQFKHDDHLHPVLSSVTGTPCLPTGSSCLTFQIPVSGHDFSGDTGYEIDLEVTDSNGLTATKSVSIVPNKVVVSFASNVPGDMDILLDQLPRSLPFELDSLIGFQHSLEAPATASAGNNGYSFDRWSNGPTTTLQNITVPSTNRSYTALYTNTGPIGMPLTGLVSWFEADSLVSTNGAGVVTTWGDKGPAQNTLTASGNPTIATSTSSGQPVIDFDGSGDVLQRLSAINGLPTGSSDRSMYVVANYRSVGYGGVAWGKPTSNQTFGLIVSTGGALEVQAWGGANDFISGTAGTNQGWLVQSAVLSGNKMTHYKNGASIGQNTHAYNTVQNRLVVGAEIDGSPNMDMQVAAIVIYDRALSTSEHIQVVSYLASKYKVMLTAQLDESPVANDDTGTVLRESTVRLSVLSNDRDADGQLDAGSVRIVAAPANGSAVVNTDGSISYTHAVGNKATSDSFTYQVSDDQGAASNIATVTLMITGVDNPGTIGNVPTSGLAAYYEADRGVSTDSGGIIRTWNDQSGNGNTLTSSGNPKVVTGPNSKPVIDFDGVDDLLALTGIDAVATGAADRSMYVVARYDGVGFGGVVYGTPAQNRAFGLIVSSTGELEVQGWGSRNDFISTYAGSGTDWLVQSAIVKNRQGSHYVNGSLIDTFSHTYATTANRLVIGAELGEPPYMDMQVAAVLIYNRALSANEHSQVQSYLQSKYLDTSTSNSAPLAENDTATVITGETVSLAVLSNDSDSDGLLNVSTVEITQSPQSGSVQVMSDGTVTYRHNGSASMTDRFRYTVKDDQGTVSNEAQVTLTITGNSAGDVPLQGLVSRFESDTLVALNSSGAVTSWGDQSLAQNTLTGSGTPMLVLSDLNGMPVIDFDGTNDVLQRRAGVTGLPAGASDRSVYAVVNYRGVGYGGVAWGKATSNQTFGLIVSTSGALEVQAWGSKNDFISGWAGTEQGWLVQSATVTGNTVKHFLNGMEIDSQSHAYNTVPSTIVVGAEIDGSPFINMQVAAIFIYNRALDAAEQQQLQQYLTDKYL